MSISISDDSPINPQTGDLWWESDAGKLKIYHDDGSVPKWFSTSQGGNIPFENFVSANLGNRKPLIWDFAPPTGLGKSSKAAGIRGAHFLDLSTSDIYEKTGDNNDTDWLQIAFLGQPRDYAAGEDYYVQFNSGDRLAGVPNYIYNYDLGVTSGHSGHFDEFKAGNTYITGDAWISGDLYVTGKTHVTEVLDYTVQGAISGKEVHADNIYISENTYIGGDTWISGDLFVTGKTHVTEILDYTVQGDISGKEFYADNVYIKDSHGDYLDVDDAIYNLSGRTLSTFGQLINDVSVLDESLSNLSGRTNATFGQILSDQYELTSGLDQLSGKSLSTFGQILSDQHGLTSGLDQLSGRSVASIVSLENTIGTSLVSLQNTIDTSLNFLSGTLISVSGESTATDISLSDDLLLLSENVIEISGESTATNIALSDDVSYLSQNFINISGDFLATDIALSDDITLLSERIDNIQVVQGNTIYGTYPVLPGSDVYNVNFALLNLNQVFSNPPHVVASFRSSNNDAYIHQVSNVTATSFEVSFSDIVVDNGVFIDFILNV